MVLGLGVTVRAELSHIQVWARVASHVITDRGVTVESILENPTLWKGGVTNVPLEAQNQSFQRLIVQAMTLEENRIFRGESVSQEEVQQETRNLEKSFGTQYRNFLAYFDLNDRALKDKISARLLLEKSLKSRVKNYSQSLSEKDQARVIEDWVSQLRGRYKVQTFRLDKNNPRLKLITEEAP